jgi:orotidine-5'-phosphate decarboxylase
MTNSAISNEFLKNPIIAALDVDSAERSFVLAEKLRHHVGAFKVGPRLIVRHGAELVSRLSRYAPVFVDNKYLDIPNTMESAIRASFEAGATLATVHAWAGPEALTRLSKVETELNRERPFKILVVTVLTSFAQETMPPGMRERPIANQVTDLARMAFQCGLTGIVCSPQEVSALRQESSSAFLVTPGVRLPTDRLGDQKRVETPDVALRLGASALVVGRPIVDDPDPVAAAERFLEFIKKGKT